MTTDLRTTPDHAAEILIDYRDSLTERDARHEISVPGREIAGVERAATHLRHIERTRNVTFATLDNDALDHVREAYDAFNDVPADTKVPAHVDDLLNAVRDLLGLGD